MNSRLRLFTDTENFTKALKVCIAAVIPVLIWSHLGNFTNGFTIGVGAFLTYPADIPSNLSHKIRGVFAAALIVATCNLIVNFLVPLPWILYPVIAFAIFFLSMISVYGQRANMVSFSGLLSISLAFAHAHSGVSILVNSVLMLLGGCFYLAVSSLFYLVRPYRYTEMQIAACMKLTSKYLKLRADLWDIDADREKIIDRQLHLQVELNAIHENLREILIRHRPDSGLSNQNRKMLLIFISLVEILEFALSASFDHNTIHERFKNHEIALNTYQNFAYKLAQKLKLLSKSVGKHQRNISGHSIARDLEQLEQLIAAQSFKNAEESDEMPTLANMIYYAQRQTEKIVSIERIFSQTSFEKDLQGREKDLEKFVVPRHYSWLTLRENLSFSSNIFRHSLRLCLTITLAFAIGAIFPLQNVYWILLTIVVILRPGYGLTKERSYHRILGTILGALIAFAVLTVVHNHILIGILTILSMLVGFTFTGTNYKVGATFVTMYVVFLYGIMAPDIGHIVELRILDTIIGAALAFTANYFFWPSWEFLTVATYVKKAIDANLDYIRQIALFYNKKGDVTSDYRLSRKNAFVETGNLMASFQRMSQDPKSKQKLMTHLYKLAVLNHSLLSAAASLGTYIQSHKTTPASDAFNVIIASAIGNLENAVKNLGSEKYEPVGNKENQENIQQRFLHIKRIATEFVEHAVKSDALHLKMELQLVNEQLSQLTSLTESIRRTSSKINPAVN